MSDVNGFIDAIGKDVTESVVPKVEGLANQLRDVVVSIIQDLAQRYHPELVGELQTTIVRDGIQLTGQNIRLDLKRRDTGASVSSLDIPVSIFIKVPALSVSLPNTTIKLDVIT
jgi:hypothetical protein